MDFSRMKEHLNHSIVCVEYTDFKTVYSPPANVALECANCNEVLCSCDWAFCKTEEEENQFVKMLDHVGHQLGIRVRCGSVPGQPMYVEIYCKQCGDVTLFTSEGATDADYGMTDYESSDIEYLKNKISELEPNVLVLELEAGSKLRQAERVRRECDQAARECLELSLADLKDSDASSRLRNLREKQDDLMEEFLSLKSAYEDEWCSVAMLKSRLEELIAERDIYAEDKGIKEREYNPEYDIPDEFFAIEEKEED